MNVNVSVEQLLNKVKTYETSKAGNGKGGDWAKTTFLPEGKHRGRIIVDSNGEVFTSYFAYGYFNKGIRDPKALPQSDLPAGFTDELATVAQTLADRGKWKFKSKEVFICPFYLEQTDSKSENWEPGNLYYVIGNKKFSGSLINFLKSVATDNPQAIQQLLDPNQQAPQLEIQLTGGQSGGCNIGVAFPQKMSDPIDLTKHVYCSVEEAYIRPGFNQEKYNALLQVAKEELEITPAKTPEGAEQQAQAQPQVAPTVTQSPVQATQPTAPSVPVQTAQVEQPQTTVQVEQTTTTPSVNPWDKFRQSQANQ